MKRYLDEHSIDVAEMYATRSCRKCHGRGYLMGEAPVGDSFIQGGPVRQYALLCTCAENNANKYKWKVMGR